MTHNLLSCWNPFPRASFERWILHSSGGGELPDEVVFNEELDGMLAQGVGRKGPHGRSFPLDLDGDILDGLLAHPGDFVCLRLVAASYGRLQSDRLPE